MTRSWKNWRSKVRARHSAVRVRTASCECEGSVQSILQCAAVAGASAVCSLYSNPLLCTAQPAVATWPHIGQWSQGLTVNIVRSYHKATMQACLNGLTTGC